MNFLKLAEKLTTFRTLYFVSIRNCIVTYDTQRNVTYSIRDSLP